MSIVIPSQARCPQCNRMVALDTSGRITRHTLWQDAIASDLTVSCMCEGGGKKAPVVLEREKRESDRKLDRILKKHAELDKKKEELQPAAEGFLNGKGLNAETFCGLLQAYRVWDSIPPRRKGHIKQKLINLGYSNNEFIIIMRGKAHTKGISALAATLVGEINRKPR